MSPSMRRASYSYAGTLGWEIFHGLGSGRRAAVQGFETKATRWPLFGEGGFAGRGVEGGAERPYAIELQQLGDYAGVVLDDLAGLGFVGGIQEHQTAGIVEEGARKLQRLSIHQFLQILAVLDERLFGNTFTLNPSRPGLQEHHILARRRRGLRPWFSV